MPCSPALKCVPEEYRKYACHLTSRLCAWCNRSVRDLCKLFHGPTDIYLPATIKIHIFAMGIVGLLLYVPSHAVLIPKTFYRIILRKVGLGCKPDPQLHCIIEGLYLGSCRAPDDAEKKEITLSKVLRLDSKKNADGRPVDKYICLADDVDRDLLSRLNDATDFIHRARVQKETVLVHCNMGISRSASVVIAYLMRFEDKALPEAIAHVKKKRPCIQPNPGFVYQLSLYEERLRALTRQQALA